MQPDGPFRMIEVLGSCPIGTVWSAVDRQGLPLTVALLDGAEEALWRDAFAAAANSLGRPGSGSPVRYSDLSATNPWVACPADGGPGAELVFLALGQDYHPVPPDTGDAQTATPAAGPVGAFDRHGPDPVEAGPVDHGPVEQGPAASGSPWPPPELPVSGPRITPSPPSVARRWRLKSRRTLIAAVAVTVLLVGAGAFTWRWSLDDGPRAQSPRPTASTRPAPFPTAAPRQPGAEPPQAGRWPTTWPRFVPTDRIRTLTGLDGLGFTVKVPNEWQCVLDGRGPGFARYRCGAAAGGDRQVGGELIVRDCPDQCPRSRQTAMRQAEEAWSLRWVSAGPMAAYAESSSLQIDGARRYGLVVVAFWRSGPDGAVDRQLVFRMTAPVQSAGQLRRVAGYLRDTVIF